MKKPLVHALVLGSFVFGFSSSLFAQASSDQSPFRPNHAPLAVELSQERHAYLGEAIASHPKVRPFIHTAEMIHQLEPGRLSVDKIDLTSKPVGSGSELEGYSEISLFGSYGWYADPVLVLRVTGFIKIDKIQEGNLVLDGETEGWGDLIITEVHIGSPMPTGLE